MALSTSQREKLIKLKESSPWMSESIDKALNMDNASNVAAGLNPDGSPIFPTLQSGLENNPAFDQMQQEALRGGESKWTSLARNKQVLEQTGEADKINANVVGQTAQGISALQRSGGSTSGARERVAETMGKNALNMQGDLNKQGAENNLQLSMNDTQNKLSQLGTVSGMKYTDTQAGNTNKMKGFEFQGQKYAADKIADATRNSGSWLCTEAISSLSKEEWKLLQKLRRYAMRKNREVTKFYLYECAPLIDRMRAMNADWVENAKFVKLIAALVKEDKMLQAFELYVGVTKTLIEKYWPECNTSAYSEVI
jgi:hypothetical protein